MWNSRKLLRKTLVTRDRKQVLNSITLLTPLHAGASETALVYISTICTPEGRQSSDKSMNRAAPCLTPSPPPSLLCRLSQSRMTVTHAATAPALFCTFTGTLLGHGDGDSPERERPDPDLLLHTGSMEELDCRVGQSHSQ